jgi:hypothetical protein
VVAELGHVASALSWGAVCFVTRDRKILRYETLARRRWRIVAPEEVLERWSYRKRGSESKML